MEPTVMLADAQATRALGSRLAQQWLALPPPNRPLLLLQGDLGAGKTCLVQGLAAALGIDEPITSPTFALAQHYQGENGALVHLDLYRLEQSAAADDLLAQEEESALELGALLAVEWPERLSLLPQPRWLLQLTLVDPQNPEAGRRADLSLQP
jgi:tRNA threonylcarbamoyladenosine biosynthesis protein TsaE